MPNTSVMYHSEKVIIQGIVFDYEQKAPFVPSGVSIYAASEYDFRKDRLRCHECGEWFASVSVHIANGGHGDMGVEEYKRKHGLALTSSLINFKGRSQRALVMNRNRPSDNPNFRAARSKVKPAAKLNSEEERNSKGTCLAQTAFKIVMLAKKLGHTPSTRELIQAGIGPHDLQKAAKAFGCETHNDAIRMIGLPEIKRGMRSTSAVYA